MTRIIALVLREQLKGHDLCKKKDSLCSLLYLSKFTLFIKWLGQETGSGSQSEAATVDRQEVGCGGQNSWLRAFLTLPLNPTSLSTQWQSCRLQEDGKIILWVSS